MHSLMQGLPRLDQPTPDARRQSEFLPTIDWSWLKIGIKGGLAAVISVLLLMWIHPAGPGSIPLVAWLLTVLGRPFLRAGGTGDLRSFQNSFLAALGLAACAGLLILTTPFLTNYFVMKPGVVSCALCIRFLHSSTCRRYLLDANRDAGHIRLCRTRPTTAGSDPDDHRCLCWFHSRHGNSDSRGKTDLAGPASNGDAR